MSDWVEDPVLKLRMRFEREGDVLIGHVEIEPRGGVSTHFHPRQEERWTVVDGHMRFKIGRDKQVVDSGGGVTVPPTVRHSLENIGSTVARARFEAEPALDLQPFLEGAAALNRAGAVNRFGVPKSFGALLDGARLIERYKDTCVLIFPPPFPPPALQGVVFGPIARLAERREHNRTAS